MECTVCQNSETGAALAIQLGDNRQMNTENDDEVLCFCSGTTRGAIQRMFKQGLDMEAISQRTGARSGCGGCEWDIEVFLKELATQQGNNP